MKIVKASFDLACLVWPSVVLYGNILSFLAIIDPNLFGLVFFFPYCSFLQKDGKRNGQFHPLSFRQGEQKRVKNEHKKPQINDCLGLENVEKFV